MYPRLLDTKTGKLVDASRHDTDLFWWSEGNGSCDCNRAICMGEEVVEEMGDLGCVSLRIVAVDVLGDLEGMPKEYILERMNAEYPCDLVETAMQAYRNTRELLG